MCVAHAYASSSVLGGKGQGSDPYPDFSRSLGMAGRMAVGSGRHGTLGRCDPPLNPSSGLRMSDPPRGVHADTNVLNY